MDILNLNILLCKFLRNHWIVTPRNNGSLVPQPRSLVNVNISKLIPASYSPKVRFPLWNARSIKNKLFSLRDFIIARQIDVMAITETRLRGDNRGDHVYCWVLEYSTYPYDHTSPPLTLPRPNRIGGGLAVITPNGLTVTENEPTVEFSAMELSTRLK